MKKYTSFTLAVLTASLTGCMSVPATKITFDPTTHTLSIKSPKNVSIGYLSAVTVGTNVTLTLTNYTSSNAPEVIAAVGKANLDITEAAAKAGKDALAAVISAMVR